MRTRWVCFDVFFTLNVSAYSRFGFTPSKVMFGGYTLRVLTGIGGGLCLSVLGLRGGIGGFDDLDWVFIGGSSSDEESDNPSSAIKAV